VSVSHLRVPGLLEALSPADIGVSGRGSGPDERGGVGGREVTSDDLGSSLHGW
jgi:hypothetical protein